MVKFILSICILVSLYYGIGFFILSRANVTDLVMDITCERVFAIPLPSSLYFRKFKELQAIPSKDKDQTLLQFVLAGYGDPACDKEKIAEVVELLLDAGFDINEIAPNGLSVLHDAIIWQDINLVEYLIELGADPKVMAKEPSEHAFMNSHELNRTLMQKDAAFSDRVKIQMHLSKQLLQ